MRPITQDKTREIIADFAKAIRERKRPTAKPSEDVINFRNEKKLGFTRPILEVPLGLLRYRKDNGRIASDVMNYEKLNGPLDETDEDAQRILRKFLEEKDPEKTEILMKSIQHSGQNEPAIITCDGFLINGNRRKMVLQKLNEQSPGNEQYQYMKVVILPGSDDPGGPPTLLEIERIENRYQLQSEGKSEYYGFDRALSIKRKIELGFSLQEQLRDDPQFATANARELSQAEKKYSNDYLRPLECAERYLAYFGREGMYATISAGQFDKAGRWQAFVDYSKVYQTMTDRRWQISNDFDEEDIGAIEDAAFKIIRLRVLPGLPKAHEIMRKLPRFCAEREMRKEVLKISRDVDASLSRAEQFDAQNNPLGPDDIDKKWAEQVKQNITHHAKKAFDYLEDSREKETPITLLETAYKKLTHEGLSLSSVSVSDLKKARELAVKIQARAHEVEQEIYRYEKDWKRLPRKK
jgi:hypothetical protein